MIRRRDSHRPGGVLNAAGWLYAELAMVLVIVAIGSESPAAPTTPPPAAPPTQPAEPGSPKGLALTPVKFTMPAPSDDTAVLDTFKEQLARTVGPDANVGLILLFGASRNPNVPVQGIRVSERVKAIVAGAGLPQLRTTVEIRPYFGGTGQPGEVTVEMFLLTAPA